MLLKAMCLIGDGGAATLAPSYIDTVNQKTLRALSDTRLGFVLPWVARFCRGQLRESFLEETSLMRRSLMQKFGGVQPQPVHYVPSGCTSHGHGTDRSASPSLVVLPQGRRSVAAHICHQRGGLAGGFHVYGVRPRSPAT